MEEQQQNFSMSKQTSLKSMVPQQKNMDAGEIAFQKQMQKITPMTAPLQQLRRQNKVTSTLAKIQKKNQRMQNALNSKELQNYHSQMDSRYQNKDTNQFENGSITMVDTPPPYGQHESPQRFYSRNVASLSALANSQNQVQMGNLTNEQETMALIVQQRINTNNQLLNMIPTLRSSKSVCKTSLSHYNEPSNTTVLSKKRGVSNTRIQRNDFLKALNTSKDARPNSFAAYKENLMNERSGSQRIPESKVIIKPKSYQRMQYERNNQFGKRTCDEYQRSMMDYTTALNPSSNEASTMYGDPGQSIENQNLRTGGYSSHSFINIRADTQFEDRYKSQMTHKIPKYQKSKIVSQSRYESRKKKSSQDRLNNLSTMRQQELFQTSLNSSQRLSNTYGGQTATNDDYADYYRKNAGLARTRNYEITETTIGGTEVSVEKLKAQQNETFFDRRQVQKQKIKRVQISKGEINQSGRHSPGTKVVKFSKKRGSKSPPKSKDSQRALLQKLILRTEPKGPEDSESRLPKGLEESAKEIQRFDSEEFGISNNVASQQSPQARNDYGHPLNDPSAPLKRERANTLAGFERPNFHLEKTKSKSPPIKKHSKSPKQKSPQLQKKRPSEQSPRKKIQDVLESKAKKPIITIQQYEKIQDSIRRQQAETEILRDKIGQQKTAKKHKFERHSEQQKSQLNNRKQKSILDSANLFLGDSLTNEQEATNDETTSVQQQYGVDQLQSVLTEKMNNETTSMLHNLNKIDERNSSVGRETKRLGKGFIKNTEAGLQQTEKEMKQVMTRAKSLINNLQEMHKEIYLAGPPVRLGLQSGQLYFLKMKVLGAAAPLKLYFEYKMGDMNLPSVARYNIINVFAHQHSKFPSSSDSQQRANSPISLEVQASLLPGMPVPKIQSTLKKFMNEYLYVTIQCLTDQEDLELFIKAKGYVEKKQNADEADQKSHTQSLSAFITRTHEKIGLLLEDPQKYEEFEKELDLIRQKNAFTSIPQSSILIKNNYLTQQPQALQNLQEFPQQEDQTGNHNSHISQNTALNTSGFMDPIESEISIQMLHSDFIQKNRMMASNITAQQNRIDFQLSRYHQKQSFMSQVEKRRQEIELETYKRNVFGLMKKRVLQEYRVEQDEIGIGIRRKRKKTLWWLHLLSVFGVLIVLKANFELIQKRYHLKQLQMNAINRISVQYKVTMTKRSRDILQRRRLDFRQVFSILGFLREPLASQRSGKLLLSFLSAMAEKDTMMNKVNSCGSKVTKAQKHFQTNKEQRLIRLGRCQDKWSEFLNEKRMAVMKLNQKNPKNKEKLQNFLMYMNNAKIHSEVGQNYYQYVVLRYQIKDLYNLIEYHKGKCIFFESQLNGDMDEVLRSLAQEKYNGHLDSVQTCEKKILRQLDQLETFLLSLGLYTPKKGKHKRTQSKKSDKEMLSNDEIIQDLIVKLSVFTSQELLTLQDEKNQGEDGDHLQELIELKESLNDKNQALSTFKKVSKALWPQGSFRWVPSQKTLQTIHDYTFAEFQKHLKFSKKESKSDNEQQQSDQEN